MTTERVKPKNVFQTSLSLETLSAIFENFASAETQLQELLKNFKKEPESTEYLACFFQVDHTNIQFRKAKITPKKEGLFVTFWKRTKNGPIAPYETSDAFDLLIINIEQNNNAGFYIFPKNILAKHGLVATDSSKGKRALRVYPPWCLVASKQAQKTQQWQNKYFFSL